MSAVNRKHRVLVTGIGIVSPLGPDLESNARSLLKGRESISPVTAFDVSRTRAKSAGQVLDDWLDDAAPCSRRSRRLHRSARMLALALVEARRNAKEARPELLVVGTTAGGMSYGEHFYRLLSSRQSRRFFPRLVGNYMPQKPVLDAQEAAGIRVPSQIVANACASGANAVGHGFELVRHGLADCVISGGYDALCELVFVGFDSLQASSPDRCRPFDRNRTGLLLGEGAAFLVLESEQSAGRRGATAVAEVTGYGISTDTHHITQPHPSGIGPRMAMERALQSAEIGPDQVDYVNGHGTATIFNDATEGIAITELFANVPVSSTKGMMGHALGAAGAIEAAFSGIAIRDQFLPPNIHFESADPGWTFEVVANRSRAATVRTVLSNSFGFGGANASLILHRV
jgi:3-oxoacyl-[acyl-carrier-protein] synthase II